MLLRRSVLHTRNSAIRLIQQTSPEGFLTKSLGKIELHTLPFQQPPIRVKIEDFSLFFTLTPLSSSGKLSSGTPVPSPDVDDHPSRFLSNLKVPLYGNLEYRFFFVLPSIFIRFGFSRTLHLCHDGCARIDRYSRC